MDAQRIKLLAVALLVVALVALPAGANQISNPGFETFGSADSRIAQLGPDDIDWMRLFENDAAGDGQAYVDDNGLTNNNQILPNDAIADWTVLGVVDLVSEGYWQAGSGEFSVDLSGSGPGGLYQAFDTSDRDPGDPGLHPVYAITFDLSGNSDNHDPGEQNGVRTLEVLIGDGTPTINSLTPGDVTFSGASGLLASGTFDFDTATLDIPDPEHDDAIADMQWSPRAMADFELPDNAITELTILVRSLNGDPYGPAIDNVSIELQGFAPEPATLGVIASGGACLLLRRRRR